VSKTENRKQMMKSGFRLNYKLFRDNCVLYIHEHGPQIAAALIENVTRKRGLPIKNKPPKKGSAHLFRFDDRFLIEKQGFTYSDGQKVNLIYLNYNNEDVVSRIGGSK